MEQLTEEQQKQVKKMSTARIRQRLIKAGFTELGLEGLSREELMDALAEYMIKQELSPSEEEEEEEGAVGGAKVKKPPEQTVESDPLPTFVNPSMTMEGIMQMMQMMMMMRQDEERRRREEKREQEEKEEKRRR